jgi:hypothetical protein
MPCLTSTEQGNTHTHTLAQKHSLPAGDLVTLSLQTMRHSQELSLETVRFAGNLAANNATLTGALAANSEIRRKSRCKQRDTHGSSRWKQWDSQELSLQTTRHTWTLAASKTAILTQMRSCLLLLAKKYPMHKSSPVLFGAKSNNNKKQPFGFRLTCEKPLVQKSIKYGIDIKPAA